MRTPTPHLFLFFLKENFVDIPAIYKVNTLISRPTVPYCNCFPIYIGRLKITVFHFLFSCTMIFSFLWVGLYYVSRFFYERYCMLLRLGIFDILCSLESSLWCRYSNSPGKKYLNVESKTLSLMANWTKKYIPCIKCKGGKF